jgi:hypothetical protein
LEFFFQTLPEDRQLFLAPRFSFLSQCVLDPAPFLQVTLLELVPLFPFQAQPRITQRRVRFQSHPFAVYFLPFPQNFPLVRAHLHPALGVSAKYLSLFRGHGNPSIARIVHIRNVSWRSHAASMRSLASLRLRLDQLGADDQNRGGRGCAYNV